MPVIVHTIPFLILEEQDKQMAVECFNSLAQKPFDRFLVVYNQGYMGKSELEVFLSRFRIRYVILGEGRNIGIPQGRQACFEYVWENLNDTKYISEIHVDMLFSENWEQVLIEYLNRYDEPMIAPGILTAFGEKHPEHKGKKTVNVPNAYDDKLKLLKTLARDKICHGMVHPVIHKSDALKHIGGYDTRLLNGRQGYEDDSILIGYRYYMGTRNGWKPKANLNTFVYHASLAQRMHMDNINEEFEKNLEGLVQQHGIYGLRQLSEIHQDPYFKQISEFRANRFHLDYSESKGAKD